jgi:hypothetical protein
MDVVKVLQSKNRCLKRLLELSDRFLTDGNLDQLAPFIAERDAIIKVLDLYDRKVTEAIRAIPLAERTPELVADVQMVLAEKDRLIQTIIAKDNELTLRIEERKRKLQEEMAATRKNHDMVGKFKSTWVAEAGEELDKTL